MKMVYLIRCENNNNYKIGVTSNIQQRIKSIQTSSPDKIELIETYHSNYAFEIEKALHNYYAHRHIINEWFELFLEDELCFKEKCLKIEKNLIYLKNNKI